MRVNPKSDGAEGPKEDPGSDSQSCESAGTGPGENGLIPGRLRRLCSQVGTRLHHAIHSLRFGLRVILGVACGLFSAWMLVYGMPLSALFGASLTAGTFTSLRSYLPIWGLGIGWLFVPLVIWQISLPEYAVETRQLACTASAASSEPYNWCEDVDYREPDLSRQGAILTLREHLAISGFNVVLATGGFLTGHSAVAWETLALMTAPSPLADATGRPIEKRRFLCQPGAPEDGTTYTWASDFFLDSQYFRQQASQLVSHARDGKPQQTVGPISGTPPLLGANNNDMFFRGPRPVTLRTALALVVPGQLRARRSKPGSVEVTWSGQIYYPSRAGFQIGLPTLHGTYQVRVDEAAFCALQMDGWMGPYRQEWVASVAVEDPRLQPPRVGRSDPGGFEALIRKGVGLWTTQD